LDRIDTEVADRFLVTASLDKTARVCDLQNGKIPKVREAYNFQYWAGI
jgi:hypothetical protein